MPTIARRMSPITPLAADDNLARAPSQVNSDSNGTISTFNDFVEDLPFYYPQSLSPSNLTCDFLSPENASENPYSVGSAQTTPSIQDIMWEPSYNNTSSADSEDATLSSNSFDLLPASDMVAYDAVQQQLLPQQHKYAPSTTEMRALMSPQLTNTPSPSDHYPSTFIGNTSMPNNPTTIPRQAMSGRQNFARSGLQVNAQLTPAQSGQSSNNSLQTSPLEPTARAVSPIVMVSSYDRSDSPARAGVILARSGSKRSRASGSSNNLGPAEAESSDEEISALENAAENVRSQFLRTDNGEWQAELTGGHGGIEPSMRGDEVVPSLKEMEEKQQLDERNAEIATWLAKSEGGSGVGNKDGNESRPRRRKSNKGRPRAHTADNRHNALGLGLVDDSNIPGPGVLLDEDSADDTDDTASYSSELPESPPANVQSNPHQPADDSFPPTNENSPEEEEPLPSQFIRAHPWQDSPRGPVLTEVKSQPLTSNAAIVKWDQQAAKFETASRAATWGTRRRLSETDVNSILGVGEGSKMQQLSLTEQKRSDRGSSIIERARGLIPRRGSSNTKRKTPELPNNSPSTNSTHKGRGESLGSIKAIERMPSFGKSNKITKSPQLDTGSALMAMTGQLAAVGRSTSATPNSAGASSSRWPALKRQRSRSELPKPSSKSAATPGLAELMSQHGGPPMPTLASPMQERPTSNKRSDIEDEEDEDDEDISDEKGVKMEFNARVEHIIPTLEGFKAHARQINPRLEPFLTERIGQEQFRRYKKLVENKVKHKHAVHTLKKCASGEHCFELGGDATLLPPRTSARDPETTYAQFQVASNGDSDKEGTAFAEGVVTAALFPSGIPLPPVKRLPAEFECSLCFKVKKFQKPSDWTKHVHEDVQPFTCTFANCTEPKSFKRKADWVRHENERHRHLEWWRCNVPECNHVCYRKDNFVQHLVREHKKPEPKVKARGGGGSKAKSSPGNASLVDWNSGLYENEIDEVWHLVEICHSDTPNRPRDEACKFCGNVLNSWKKLTVHLAKHMEQISMPVLELVRQREVTPDTVISPVEKGSQPPMLITPSPQTMTKPEPTSVSPYSLHAAPQYQEATAMQSSADLQQYYHPPYSQNSAHNINGNESLNHAAQAHSAGMADFTRVQGLPQNIPYGPYQGAQQHQTYSPIPNGGAVSYPPPYNAVRQGLAQISPQIPRSYPSEQAQYGLQTSNFQQMHYDQQQSPASYSSPIEAVNYAAQFGPNVPRNQGMTSGSITPSYDTSGVHPTMGVSREQMYDPRSAMAYTNIQAQAPERQSYMYPQ